ncbi:MAG: hypothetical protein JWQ43_2310 [Glaciihabitans sp.]|nr:hypothetical protein [Glaciihabitans sp.]
MLLEYLDFQRATLLIKAEGLSQAQLAQTLPPSTLTLAGLLKHAAVNEHSWLFARFGGNAEREPWAGVDWDADEDWEFHSAVTDDPEYLRQLYLLECARSRGVVATADLDDLAVEANNDGKHWSLRWILLHLIEKTARHVGHADLLRESIDGATGE